jgi:TolA-binding protein
MALNWLSVLQAVPWTDVISNAPKVAEGARKLWKSAGGRDATAEDAPGQTGSPVDTPTGAPDAAVAQLQARARHLEQAVDDLRQQLQQSTELIKTLAEQNTQLVARVEMNRVRAQRTLVLAAAALALSLGALALALLR